MILVLNKEENKAIKVAIEALKKVRKEFAVGKNLYEKYGAETQERQYKEYQKYSKAIKVLEELAK